MKDEQVDRILTELSRTRESFELAIQTVRWTRLNRAIQYSLIVVVLIIMATGLFYYRSDQRNSCHTTNDIRVSIQESDDRTAVAIGVALTEVYDVPQEDLEQYLRIYADQPKSEALDLKDC